MLLNFKSRPNFTYQTGSLHANQPACRKIGFCQVQASRVYYSGSRGRYYMMAARHVRVPKSFSDGDAHEWLQRFEIYAAVNQWDGAIRH